MADDNYPQEGELVIATVTKIQYHSIFCDLDEYPGRSGMLHISEIAPGRIRNVNDYVKEGKSVIAKVLRVDKNKGHIDLSIRRVTEAQRKQKSAERKHEKLVQNIIEQVAEQLGQKPEQLRASLEDAIDYDLYDAFTQVVEDETTGDVDGRPEKRVDDDQREPRVDRVESVDDADRQVARLLHVTPVVAGVVGCRQRDRCRLGTPPRHAEPTGVDRDAVARRFEVDVHRDETTVRHGVLDGRRLALSDDGRPV